MPWGPGSGLTSSHAPPIAPQKDAAQEPGAPAGRDPAPRALHRHGAREQGAAMPPCGRVGVQLGSLKPQPVSYPQGNLVNFLRTRGRALVNTPQLLQFSL